MERGNLERLAMDIDRFRRYRHEEPEATISLIADVPKNRPDYYLFLIEVGRALDAINRPSQAIEFYHKAFEVRPDNSHAVYVLSEALRVSGNISDAAALCIAFMSQHGVHDDCTGSLARSDPESAIHLIRTSTDVPNFGLANTTNLAVAYAHSNRWSQARSLINCYTAISQHRARLWFTVLLRTNSISVSDIGGDKPEPNHIIQYWDQEKVPPDVRALMSGVQKASSSYTLLSKQNFITLANRHFGFAAKKIVEACWHPAAQSDLARLLLIFEKGGIYIDADMQLRKDEPINLRYKNLLLTAATRLQYPVITNWLIGGNSGNEFIADCAERIARVLTSHQEFNLSIFDTSGPGIITEVFIDWFGLNKVTEALYAESSLTEVFSYNGKLEYKKFPETNWAINKDSTIQYIPGEEIDAY